MADAASRTYTQFTDAGPNLPLHVFDREITIGMPHILLCDVAK
jgi:hypothetical protein